MTPELSAALVHLITLVADQFLPWLLIIIGFVWTATALLRQ